MENRARDFCHWREPYLFVLVIVIKCDDIIKRREDNERRRAEEESREAAIAEAEAAVMATEAANLMINEGKPQHPG